MPPKGSIKPYDPHRPGFWLAVFVLVTGASGIILMPEVPAPELVKHYVTYLAIPLIFGFGGVWLHHQLRQLRHLPLVIGVSVVAFFVALYFAVIA